MPKIVFQHPGSWEGTQWRPKENVSLFCIVKRYKAAQETNCPGTQQVGNGNANQGNGPPGRKSTGEICFQRCRAASWDTLCLDFFFCLSTCSVSTGHKPPCHSKHPAHVECDVHAAYTAYDYAHTNTHLNFPVQSLCAEKMESYQDLDTCCSLGGKEKKKRPLKKWKGMAPWKKGNSKNG